MKQSFKKALLASAVIGLAGVSFAQAGTKDGLYLTPNAEVIFVNSAFTKGVTSVGVGGGAGLAFGYQIKKFQIELAANYQYYGGNGTVEQTVSAIPGGAGKISTTVDSTEHFIPITLGLNYVIPVNASGSLALTPGIAGGVWIHSVNRTIAVAPNAVVTGAAAAAADARLAGLALAPKTDEATEVKGVIVPSLALDYAPSANWTVRFGGKFYIVPAGYSDNYADLNRTAANAGAAFLSPSYNAVDTTFWYGAINVGAQYTF